MCPAQATKRQSAPLRQSAPPVEGNIAAKALYEEVAGRLRQSIFSQDLAPGARIDEQALAQVYGISRTPLREALKLLASEGLVVLKPRHGCYVVQVSQRDVEEVFAVLALLEGQCAYEAVEKAQPEDFQRLEIFHRKLELCTRKKDRTEWFEINQEFHRALDEMSGNHCMIQLIGNLWKVVKLVRFHSLVQGRQLEQCLEEHARIMAAIRLRDPAAVKQAMTAHLLNCGSATSEGYLPRHPTEDA